MSQLCSIHHDIPVTLHTPGAYGQWSVFDHNVDKQPAVLGTRYGTWRPLYGRFEVGWLQPLQLWLRAGIYFVAPVLFLRNRDLCHLQLHPTWFEPAAGCRSWPVVSNLHSGHPNEWWVLRRCRQANNHTRMINISAAWNVTFDWSIRLNAFARLKITQWLHRTVHQFKVVDNQHQSRQLPCRVTIIDTMEVNVRSRLFHGIKLDCWQGLIGRLIGLGREGLMLKYCCDYSHLSLTDIEQHNPNYLSRYANACRFITAPRTNGHCLKQSLTKVTKQTLLLRFTFSYNFMFNSSSNAIKGNTARMGFLRSYTKFTITSN